MSVGVSQTVVTPYVTEIAPVRTYWVQVPPGAEQGAGPMSRCHDRYRYGLVRGHLPPYFFSAGPDISKGKVSAQSHAVS